ncbi:MAG: AsnC family protein [Desulfobacterales bacterium CG23_combo_of_CG06-09_8_20_14_all_51_8]|nr:MAG: AsnC family protein [Desulfobacterales bacterium CG23_combo_of_CG06-09_8_20_14_all_51_8]
MDATDKAILNRIQSDFPLASRPFQAIADEFHLTEAEVLQRIRRLKDSGIIRRIGGNFVPGKLGYVSTLCAAKVPADKIPAFADAVNRHTGVTHNYVRENAYNVWFTFIAPSMEFIETCLAEISEKTGVIDIINLPATHVFKIKAHFNL